MEETIREELIQFLKQKVPAETLRYNTVSCGIHTI